jgi:hypothetical protein
VPMHVTDDIVHPNVISFVADLGSLPGLNQPI